MASNTLTKTITTTFTAGTTGQAYVAGHWETVTTTTTEQVVSKTVLASTIKVLITTALASYSTTSEYIAAYTKMYNALGYVVMTATSGLYIIFYLYNVTYTTATVTKTSTVWVDEQEYVAATDASVTTDYHEGWNAGARSISLLGGNGVMKFSGYIGIAGAVIGMAKQHLSVGYAHVLHGFYLTDGTAYVYESGVQMASLGNYTNDTVFAIKRIEGAVTYYMDDSLVYTSSVESSGDVMMEVCLYSGGDAIFDPSLSDYNSAAVTMGRMRATSSETGNYCNVALGPLKVYGSEGNHCKMTFGKMSVFASDHNAGRASVGLGPFSVYSTGGLLTPSKSRAALCMGAMVVSSTGLTGGVGSAAVTMGAMSTFSSDHKAGKSAVTMGPISVYASGTEGYNHGYMTETMICDAGYSGSGVLTIAMTADLQCAIAVECSAAATAEMSEQVGLLSEFGTSQVLMAAINEFIGAGCAIPPFEDVAEVWVVSPDGESTRYDNFAFNSFAKIGKHYFGAKAGGIYLLEGDDDAGDPIEASINFGTQSFGSSAVKRIEAAYIGASSDGKIYLKVVANGEEYLYAARDVSEHMATTRIGVGRGIAANYMTFFLYNSEGCDFRLEDIEFAALDMKRRI